MTTTNGKERVYNDKTGTLEKANKGQKGLHPCGTAGGSGNHGNPDRGGGAHNDGRAE